MNLICFNNLDGYSVEPDGGQYGEDSSGLSRTQQQG